MSSRPGITYAQRNVLFRMVADAAREVGEMPEAYRKRVMREELGVDHLADVSRGSGFDRLMARVCRDAGDDVSAIRYALASTARLRRLVIDAAEALAPGHALAYIAGVLLQSRTVHGYDQPTLAARLASDSGWLDLTDAQLRRVLAMLKTHLRRHAD